jgi:predicted GIY-YIG superfamily endonuclease
MTRRFVQRRNTYWRGKGAQFVQRHGFKNIFQFGHFATERGAKAAEGEITAMLQGEGLVCAGGGWTGEKEAHFL